MLYNMSFVSEDVVAASNLYHCCYNVDDDLVLCCYVLDDRLYLMFATNLGSFYEEKK
jgi:hypothetical protein